MSLRIRPSLIVFPLVVLAILAGCVTSVSPYKSLPRSGEEPPLVFPDADACIVSTSSILHEVKLYFEMDRLPKTTDDQDGKVLYEEEPVLGQLKFPGEEYFAGYGDNPLIVSAVKPGGEAATDLAKESPGIHRFSYDHGMFDIGGFRYPAEQYGELIIFRERPGSFTFEFHGRKVTVERSSPWKPAVLYRLNREEAGGRERQESPERQVSPRNRQRVQSRSASTRIVSEEVQVGPHRIIAPPGATAWRVNEQNLQVPSGASITIDRRGGVRSSS